MLKLIRHWWRLHKLRRLILTLPPLPLPHRDDVPHEALVEAERYGRIIFPGDLSADDPLAILATIWMRAATKGRDIPFWRGLCSGCATKFPGEWPASDSELAFWGWSTGTTGEVVDRILCPGCVAVKERVEA